MYSLAVRAGAGVAVVVVRVAWEKAARGIPSVCARTDG